jgi:hypothetical protein
MEKPSSVACCKCHTEATAIKHIFLTVFWNMCYCNSLSLSLSLSLSRLFHTGMLCFNFKFIIMSKTVSENFAVCGLVQSNKRLNVKSDMKQILQLWTRQHLKCVWSNAVSFSLLISSRPQMGMWSIDKMLRATVLMHQHNQSQHI